MDDDKIIKYSICMCNYNMGDTIQQSLESLLPQLNDQFEVIVVDDGSDDESVLIVERLMLKYANLRLVALRKDSRRKLGYTRNISIENAVGEFVLLHLDCDDIFGPYIVDFVGVFHEIESAVGHDILLSGQHINMARRTFLLDHGPYINIYRGEDRNLWSRLGAIDAWIPFDHIDFITRLPKTRKRRLIKNIFDTYDHMKNDFRSEVKLSKYFCYELKKKQTYSKKLFLFRIVMLIPCWFMAKFEEPIYQGDSLGTPEKFALYREKMRGTYSEIMQRYGKDPELEFLSSKDAEEIFLNRGKLK